MRVNLNEAPSKKQKGLKKAPSNSSDVIYEYLKSFSKYRNRKTGLLIKNNQHIEYNFNSKKILKRGDEALINKSLKKLKTKTNKNKSTFGVIDIAKAKENIKNFSLFAYCPDALLPAPHQQGRTALARAQCTSKGAPQVLPWPTQQRGEQGVKVTSEGNKNKNYLLNKPLLGLYSEFKKQKNTPRAPFVIKPRTVKANAPLNVPTVIDPDLNLKLKRLNNLSLKTGNIRKGNNRLIKYSYKLLFYFFKSMYCLISKPVFLFTPDKVVIQLKYFLIIPKYKVFKWYSIFKFKLIRRKMEALIKKKKIKQRKRLEKNKFNLHSGAELAQELNHNENLSSNHSFNSDSPKKTYHKVNWKVARTLNRLNNKRTLVQKILFNLNKYNLFRVFSPKFKLICEILNKKFKKPVEFQLIRIHQPYQDSNILVNLLSLNIRNKKFKTNVQIEKLFQKRVVKNVYDYQNKSVNFIPTYLSGINIRIGGRLMREIDIPRKSQKRFERGARSIGKVNYLDSASITNKNRKGSYTLKISSGQNFF